MVTELSLYNAFFREVSSSALLDKEGSNRLVRIAHLPKTENLFKAEDTLKLCDVNILKSSLD